MPDIEDLLSDAEQRRERAVAMLAPREGAVRATVTRIRRRRAVRRGVQIAVVVPVVAAIGVGAWAATGRSAPPPAETPTVTTTPTPEDSTTPTPSETPTSTPTPTGPEVTDAVRAAYDVEVEWFRMGGQVPVDAPLSTFPMSPAPIDFDSMDGIGCTREQLDWLLAHGTAESEGLYGDALEPPAATGTSTVVPVRTYALASDTEAPVTMQNVRVQDVAAEDASARIRFGCINGGIGGYGSPYYVVGGTDGSPATFAVIPDFPDAQLPAGAAAGTPFATTLSPGASFALDLVLAGVDPTHDFRGRVVADAVIDGVTYEAVIDENLELLAPPSVTSVYAVAGFGRLFCLPDEATYYDAVSSPMLVDLAAYECTPEELAAAVGGGA